MKLELVIAILALLSLGAHCAHAQIVIQPGPAEGKDAWVRSESPDVNNGDHSDIRFGASPTFSEERHAYLEFDLAELPAGTVIADAALELYMWGQNGWMSYIYGIYPVTAAWGEHTITWNSAPTTTEEPALEFDGADWQGDWGRWHKIPGFTELVQSWIDDPTANHGFMIRAVSNYYGEPYVYSSDSAQADLRPRLILELAPISAEAKPWSQLKDYFANDR